MRKPFVITALLSLILAVSCSKEEPVSIYSNNIILSDKSITTSFTAELSGTFSGVDKTEIALGKHGVLYCLKSDDPESTFRLWKDGNDNPGCKVVDKTTVSGETMQCSLSGLAEDTEYSCCMFLQNRDGTREISAIFSFRTKPFNPEIKELKLEGIHCFIAFAEGIVSMDIKDAAFCETGVIVSDKRGATVENSTLFKFDGEYESVFTLRLNGLEPDKDYYCRTYVKYPMSQNQSGYLYGTEKAFKTKNFQDVAVDLGLTSGNLWAMTNVGADSPEKYGMYYAWGETESKSNFTWSNYQWKNENNKYNTDSTSIYISSKTNLDLKDDAANYNLGGAWRIPDIKDYDELWAECDVYETSVNGVTGVGITGVNGNSIFIPYGGVITEGTEAVLKGSYYYTYTSTLYYGAANGYYYTKYPFGDDPLYLGPGHDWTHQFNRSSGFTIRPVYPVN